MAKITTDTNTMRSKANELKDLNEQFNRGVVDLVEKEEALNGMWDGAANDQFHQDFTQSVASLYDFKRVIDDYINAINSIAQKYDEHEAKATETAKNTQRG